MDDVIGVSLILLFSLTSWTGQLSGWSGSLWQYHLSRFPSGKPGDDCAAHVFWAVSSLYVQEYVSFTPRWRRKENVVVSMRRDLEQQKWNRFRFRSTLRRHA